MKITLAGGCFWGLEAALNLCKGVSSSSTGFANGNTETMVTYEQVYTDTTGFAEAVDFKLEGTSLSDLLDYFLFFTDPTTLNAQGPDKGTRYRTILLYRDQEQRRVMEAALSRAAERYAGKPIHARVEPLKTFVKASEYHQRYLERNPGGYCHLNLAACKAYLERKGLLG